MLVWYPSSYGSTILGISNKIARITQEIDYRLIDPLPLGSQYAAADHKRNVSVDSIMEVAEETILTAASKEDAIDIEIPNTQQAGKLTKVVVSLQTHYKCVFIVTRPLSLVLFIDDWVWKLHLVYLKRFYANLLWIVSE